MALRMWVVVAATVALAAWVAAAWYRRDRTAFTWILIAATAAVLGWQGWLEYRWQSNEARYANAVSSIAPTAVIHCQRFSEALIYARGELGYVPYSPDGTPTTTATLTYETCGRLRDWVDSDKTAPTIEQITAVHILSHEAQHVAGHTSEADAECYAIQADAAVAAALGATPTQAAALADTYYTDVYPRVRDGYRSPDCVPDGALDLTPGDSAWP